MCVEEELVKKGGVLPSTKSCLVVLVSFVCVCLCVTNDLKQFGGINKLQYLERMPYQQKLVFMRVLQSRSNWNLKYWFLTREENRRTWRKTLGARREPTTNRQPIYGTGLVSNPAHIGGTRALSLLCHPCSLMKCDLRSNGRVRVYVWGEGRGLVAQGNVLLLSEANCFFFYCTFEFVCI